MVTAQVIVPYRVGIIPHQYTIELLFSYSGPLELLGSDMKQNNTKINASGGKLLHFTLYLLNILNGIVIFVGLYFIRIHFPYHSI